MTFDYVSLSMFVERAFNNKNTHTHSKSHACMPLKWGQSFYWVYDGEKGRPGEKETASQRDWNKIRNERGRTENWQKIDITMARVQTHKHKHKRQRAFTFFGIYLFVQCAHTQYIVDLFFLLRSNVDVDVRRCVAWCNVCRIELTRPCVPACVDVCARSHPHTIRANWMKWDADAWCVEPISI